MDADPDELLELADLARLFKLSKREVQQMVHDGLFPPPSLYVGRGKRQPRWTRTDFRAYVHMESKKSLENHERRQAKASESDGKQRKFPDDQAGGA